jgi:hypothetical protein
MNKSNKKKARGFSTIKTSKRLTRGQKSTINKELTILVDDLKKKGREESLEKHIKKLQSITRGRLTRKKLPEKKLEVQKMNEKKMKILIGPKYNKTLKELNSNLLDKLLSNTIKKFNIEDEDIKHTIIATIIGNKYSEIHNKIIKYIIEIQKKYMIYINKWFSHKENIILYSNGPMPSSASEDEIEHIQFEIHHYTEELNNKIINIQDKLNPLLKINNKIIIEYKKIINLLNIKNIESKKNFDTFIQMAYQNWDKLFYEAGLNGTQSLLNLENIISDTKKNVPIYGIKNNEIFITLVSELLSVYVQEKINDFDRKFMESFNKIEQYHAEFLTIISKK